MEQLPDELKNKIKNYIIFKPKTNEELQRAIDSWFECEEYALELYNHISLWDTSLITDMSHLFEDKDDFNENINNWNVSKVTNMSGMFLRAGRFNQPLNSWDVSSVTDMSWMFSGSSFEQNINSWDVSSVTSMYFMFSSPPKYYEENAKWYKTCPFR